MAQQAEAVTAIVFDARQATAGADQVEAAGERIIKTEQGIVTATERVRKAQADTIAAYQRLERQLDPLAARQQALERGMNLVNRQYERGKINADEHARMLGLLNQRYRQLDEATETTGRGMGKFSQAVGQGGLQMQDLAVQVMGGTSAFVALGQQLPQFLGIFGPGGAIAGAVVAVAALGANLAFMGDKAELATGEVSILDSVMKSLTGNIDDQRETMEKLAAAYDKASGARQDLMRVELQQRLVDEAKAIKAQEAALNDIIERVGRGIDVSQAGAGDYDRQMAAFRELRELARRGQYEDLIDQLQRIGGVAGELAGEALTASRAILNLRDSSNQAREFLANLANGMLNLNESAREVSVRVEDLGEQMLAYAADQLAAAMQRYDEIMQRGRQVADSVRTTWEVWADEQAKLNQLLAAGAINAETFARAMDKANPIVRMQADLLRMVTDSNDSGMAAITRDFDIQVQADFKAALSKGDVGEALRKPLVSAMDRAALSAGDAFGNIFTRIQAGDWGSVAEGVGIFQDRMRALEEQTGSSSAALAELGKALLDSAEAGNALGNMLGSLFGRSAAQNENAQKGGAIGGTIGSFIPGGKAAGAFIGNVIGGMFGMSKADERAAKMAAEVVELSKGMNAFVRAASPLRGLAGELSALDDQFAQLRAEAMRLKQPVEELTKSYEIQRRKIAESFGQGVDDLIDRLTGRQAQADFRELMRAQDQRIKDSLLAEYDLAKVRRANALELEEFFSALSERQLDAFGSLVTVLDRIKARVRDLTATVSDQLDTQVDLARQLAQQSRQQAQAYRQLAASLREQITGNLTGDLSPLSPGDRYSALSGEFDRLLAAAMGGDQTSADKIAQAGTSLLEASKAMNATGPNYVNDFDRVQKALAQVATVADIRATALDRIADLADTQVVILERIRDVLSTDLGKPTADAIAAAISDGVLTVQEIDSINSTLDDLYGQFSNLPGASAQAVRLAIEAIRPQLIAGTLTEEQKAQLTGGQGQLAQALNTFKADQLEQYRQALISAGSAITSISDFLLDPNGKIPAAIENAFNAIDLDLALSDAIETLFTDALGGDISFPPLVVQAGQTISDAVGEWTAEALSARINSQFGTAIADWSTSADPRTLVDRVNGIFQRAVGGEPDWQLSLKDLLDGQSPLVSNLQMLTVAVTSLTSAMRSQPANDNGAQTAYDSAMQSYVSGIQRAATQAAQTVSTIPFDDRSGSHNNRSNLFVDAATGATMSAGGNKENDSSRQRAAQLASGLYQLGQQIQALAGGTLPQFQVQASEEKSGYSIGALNRLNTFGGNDYEAIARNFVSDAVSALQGGNAAAIDILKATDWSNLTRGFSEAAASIYQLLHPRPMANGGVVTGGIPGRDSVPLLAMPGERLFSVPHSVMLETIYRQAARGSQGQVASDPAQLAELRAIRQEMAAGREREAQGRAMIADLTARLVKSNEQLAKLARTEKAGGR